MKNKILTIKIPLNSLIPTPDKTSKGFKTQSHLSYFSPDADKSPLPIGDILKSNEVVSKNTDSKNTDSKDTDSTKMEFRPRVNAFFGSTEGLFFE